jgi:hypothetical protein
MPVDIITITIDNDQFARSCCCIFSRQDFYVAPVFLPDGDLALGLELYNRKFARTVVRASTSARCNCGAPPIFPPTTVRSQKLFMNQDIPLAGGPSTMLRAIPGTPCSAEGFQPPSLLEAFTFKIP